MNTLATLPPDEAPTLEQRVTAIEQCLAKLALGSHNAVYQAAGSPPQGLFAPPVELATTASEAIPDAATAPYVRRVVCAANSDQKYGIIFIGPRHFDDCMTKQMVSRIRAHELTDRETQQCLQGFIDQHGVFMSREEALAVAKAAGQIRYRCGGDETQLFSENLY